MLLGVTIVNHHFITFKTVMLGNDFGDKTVKQVGFRGLVGSEKIQYRTIIRKWLRSQTDGLTGETVTHHRKR